MSRVISLGLVGAGAIGAYHCANIQRQCPFLEVKGIADADLDRARAVAKEMGVPDVHESAKKLMDDPAIEGIIIATPARFHSDLIVQAAASGKSVFCEKPMGTTPQEAKRAFSAAKAAGTLLQVGFNRRLDRDFRAAKQEIAEGRLGSVLQIRSITRDPRLHSAESIPQDTLFLETLIHDIDVAHFFNPGAQVTHVSALAHALIRPDLADKGWVDTGTLQLQFDNGATANLDACFQSLYGYDVRAEVFGSQGLVSVGAMSAQQTIRFDENGGHQVSWEWYRERFHYAYIEQLERFGAAMATGMPDALCADGDAAYQALCVAHAAIESHRCRRTISLE